MPNEAIESNLSKLGFDEGHRGVHTSRTMMFKELELVLATLPNGSSPQDIRLAIIEDNVLGKATRSGRKYSANKLIDLYSFNPELQLFFAFEFLWREASASRPVLALMLALCRDCVLRTTVESILRVPFGHSIPQVQLYECLLLGFTSKYAETTLQSTAQNAASSWRQSGHIRGRNPIVRTKAPADFHALAFAILIGYLRGLRGHILLASDWISILDFNSYELESAIIEAHKHGLITSRKIGEVIELTPGPHLLKGGDA